VEWLLVDTKNEALQLLRVRVCFWEMKGGYLRFLRLFPGLYCPLSLLRMKRL